MLLGLPGQERNSVGSLQLRVNWCQSLVHHVPDPGQVSYQSQLHTLPLTLMVCIQLPESTPQIFTVVSGDEVIPTSWKVPEENPYALLLLLFLLTSFGWYTTPVTFLVWPLSTVTICSLSFWNITAFLSAPPKNKKIKRWLLQKTQTCDRASRIPRQVQGQYPRDACAMKALGGEGTKSTWGGSCRMRKQL